MSRRSLGTLTIDVVAEVGGFVSGMDKAERAAEKWRKQTEVAAIAAGTAIGNLAADAVHGLFSMSRDMINSGVELSKLAQIAGTGTTEFQRYAVGANALGIQQEKLADIFKDTQDKVGDFLQNGGGPLKDFFDNIAPKVGVTAKQFHNLSGPQGLQLYVDSLQKAGVSQQDMVFYLEAIASDATMLLPLLRDGGEGFREFGNAAEAAGAIMGEATVANALRLKAEMFLVEQQVTGFKNNLVSEILPVLADIGATLLESGKDAKSSLSDYNVVGTLIRWVAQGAAIGAGLFEVLGKRIAGVAAVIASVPDGVSAVTETMRIVSADIDATYSRVRDRVAELGQAGSGAGRASSQVDALAKAFAALQQSSGNLGDQGKGAAAAKAAAAAQEQLRRSYAAAVVDYERRIALTKTEAGKVHEITEAEKARFEIASGKYKQYSEDQQKVLLAKAEELDRTLALKRANEELAKVVEFRANLEQANRNAGRTLDLDFVGAGQGQQARERARELLSIEADFQRQRDDLFRQYQAGDITESLYKSETDALSAALQERLRLQEDYYRRSDEQRADWMSGASDAWADYATRAADYNQQAYESVSGFLDTTTGDVANTISELVKGNEDLFGSIENLAVSMGETVIDTLSKMAAQWLVYKAVQLAVGESAETGASTQMISNAAATAAQAAIAAYASTAAIPIVGPSLAPAAASTALAATAPYVAAVSALSGMAHDGIDSVPKTGTWLLEKGERVTTAGTSAKLDATLDRISRDVQGGGGGGGTYAPTIYVNGNPDDRTLQMLDSMLERHGRQQYARLANEISSGTGTVYKALTSATTVSRRTR